MALTNTLAAARTIRSASASLTAWPPAASDACRFESVPPYLDLCFSLCLSEREMLHQPNAPGFLPPWPLTKQPSDDSHESILDAAVTSSALSSQRLECCRHLFLGTGGPDSRTQARRTCGERKDLLELGQRIVATLTDERAQFCGLQHRTSHNPTHPASWSTTNSQISDRLSCASRSGACHLSLFDLAARAAMCFAKMST